MLEKSKILKNAEKFFKTGQQYGFMSDQLIAFLGETIVGAPASTSLNMYGAYDGGLIDHSLRVTKYAVSLNDLLPETLRVSKESLVKVCILHQIGKTFLFKPCTSDWHVKQGKVFDFNENIVSMRVGERSVYYALSNGTSLTEQEYQAIVNFDKDDSDLQAKYHSTTLAMLLKQANEMAIMEVKNIK
jgi:hypothetical protein